MDRSSAWSLQESYFSIAERAEGRELTPSEVSSYWYRRGLAYWAEHPRDALALAGKKLLLSINGEEMGIHHSYPFGKEMAPFLGFLLSFGVVFPFSVVGVVFAAQRYPDTRMLAACALAYLLTLVAYYVADRYRIAVLPMLLPLAGLGMVELERRFRSGSLRAAGPVLLVLAVSFGASQIPVSPEAWRQNSIAFSYNWMGKREMEQGDLAGAEVHLKRAAEVTGRNPGRISSWTWTDLANLHLLRGDNAGAKELYRKAVAAHPGNRFALVWLARISETEGKVDEAIRWWQQVVKHMPDPQPALEEISRLRGRSEQNATERGRR